MITISKATFDTTSIATLVTGVSGQQINVVGIVIMNNESDESTQTRVRLVESSPAVDLYGDSTASIMLQGQVGKWGLKMTRESIAQPYFVCSTGKSLFISCTGGYRIAGAIWYYIG